MREIKSIELIIPSEALYLSGLILSTGAVIERKNKR